MAGLVDGTINGYLDVRGAILRVGQLDVVGISGVDMATNVIKQDSVLIWDDQGTDLNNPPFTLRGGATRDTTNGYHVLTGASGGRLTRGVKLPNAWMMDFDLYASTSGGTVKIHTYTTQESTYDGTSGYELEFAPSGGTVTLKYRGTQVHQATSVTAYATNTFQHYVIGFERGAWTVSIDGTVVFLKDDDERADVYDNTAGQYFRIDASASATHEIRMRKFRLASNGFWLKERNGNLSYETGNVSVGGRNATHRFDVRGTANVGALTSTTVATSASVEATDTATGTVTTHSIGVVSNAHVQNVYVSNCIVDASLNVFSTANVGALTATSVDASDATAATSVSTGAIVVSGTDGGLGVASNIHATNVFAASHLGVATSDTAYNLDVRGTANVGVLSATLPLATVASNLVTYDTATGQLLDSNGLVSNKLAIVSEQPPSALTGDSAVVVGHGRYKVTSTGYVGANYPYHIFSKIETDAWISDTDTYSATDGTYAGSGSLGGVSGEWVKLELPYKTTLRHFTLRHDTDITNEGQRRQFPVDFKVVASNDDINWTTLNATTGLSMPGTTALTTAARTFVVDDITSYKFYAIVVEKITTGANWNRCHIGEWRLFTDSLSVNEGVVELPGALEKGFMEQPVTPFTGSLTYNSTVGSEGVFEPTTHFVEGHGTYEASASSSYNASGQAQRPVWHLFDRSSSTKYQMSASTGLETYATSSPYAYNGSLNTTTVDVGGGRYVGVWVQLKVPRAFALAHAKLTNSSGMTDRAPSAGVLLGSNDGIAWYKLTEFSSLTYASNEATVTVNATTSYQYFRMVVTNTVGSATVNFTEWRLFASSPVTKLDNVHISGDLSSETIQTGYIKWPRVPLLADSYEGYELSSSSNHNAGLSNEYFPWHAFNELPHYEGNWTPSWASLTNTFTLGAANTSRTTGEDTFNHEWVQVKFPQAIRVSYLRMKGTTGSHSGGYTPKSGRVYASDDGGVTWTKVSTYSGLSYASGDDYATVKLESAASYDYWRVCFTETIGSSTIVQVDEIRFFETATGIGAPPTSAKLQVAGSLGMAKGSSLFAGDSVVMETPKHDRPLVKYPEVKMTAASTGGYVASASGAPNSSYNHFHAFNNIVAEGGGSWHSGTTYATSGSRESTVSSLSSWVGGGGGHNGEWLKIQLPHTVVLKRVNFRKRIGAQHPRLFSVVGSNDDSRWYLVHEETSRTFTAATAPNPDHHIMLGPYASTAWKYFAVVIRTGATDNNYNHVAIGDWELWGTEEGDESVDVVHRSVPNKPGTQQLEVYWDANDSNSYSFADSTKVYDLSGNGVTGTITGTNGFDSEYNAWVFDGSAYISGTLTHTTGAWAHAVSTWVYRDATSSTTNQHIFHFGGTSTNTGCALRFQLIGGRWVFRYYFFANDVLFYATNIGESFGNWLHITATYDGGSDSGVVNGSYGLARKLYVNGVPCEVQSSSGAGSLNLGTTSSTFYAGNRQGSALQHDLRGKMANARVYSKALSADQVKELYDYEAARFGIREDLVSVHKGNFGIGLRDPEQRLVVAGSLQEFPPGPMTDEYTQFTGHGVFRATASSVYQGTSSMAAYAAFDGNTGSFWHSASSYSSATGYNPHTGSQKITAGDGTEYSGEYIQLSMPYQIHLKRIAVSPRTTNFNRGPHTATLLARRNGTDWVVVASWGNLVWTTTEASNGVMKYIEVNSEQLYSEFVLVVHLSNDSVNLSRMVFFGVPQMNVTDGRQLNVGQVMTSSVGIGTAAPHAPLTVFGYSGSLTAGVRRYFAHNDPTSAGGTSNNVAFGYVDSSGTNPWGQHSIFASSSIVTNSYFVTHAGTFQASDRRIKENVLDVNDSSALETFRLLQPKLYNYKDVVDRGSLPVWGFIAQEVADTLTHSTGERTEFIPNIYELANVYADGAVLEFDTTKLEAGASRLRLYDQSNNEEDVDIAEIIDEYTVRLKTSIGNADQVFVFGQEVNDFHFLKKDAIWTTAAAALQQVDHELQAEKAKTKALESKLAGERVPLENAEGLAVDANHAPCVTANDPLFLGIVDADGRVAAKGKRAKVWVTNIGAPLSAGDIIATTSNIAGYCTKLTDLTEVHRAVGKVLVDVALPQVTDHNFVAPAVPRRRKVTETSDVTVWVREFKSTADRYATLPEDERRVRDEVYYARDDVVEVVRNEFVDKMPAYDVEAYHRTQIDTCDAEIYEALPDSEKVNYVLGVDGVYVYTHINMITVDAWNALGDDDERDSFVHGYFKNVTEELTEDEWEALEDSFQARYEKRTRPVYFRLIVARESRVGYTEEVRAETVDVLDAFGRPTYEDVEGETDPAFEFRYLTAEGEITDRHSGVYMAAMVECLLF